jgi:hypothetical protein
MVGDNLKKKDLSDGSWIKDHITSSAPPFPKKTISQNTEGQKTIIAESIQRME